MGIPKYHKWLTERYPQAFTEAQAEKADHVYVDVNALLHDVMRHATSEDGFFSHLFTKFDSLFRTVAPGKSVFLAVDGPASCAKCLTQRQRRRAHAQKDAKNPRGAKGGKGKGKSSKGKGKRPVHEQDEAKIFVVGIPKTSTEEEVRAYFAQFGAVKAVEMLKDHRTGQCRTYCFVTFEDPLVAKAIQSVPGLELGGSILELSSAWPTKEEEAGPGAAQDPGDADATKIFVGGLMRSTQEEEVQQFFSQFGSITEVLLKKDPSTGASRGFGFITFADEASMQRALANYDSNLIGGKWVDVRRAEAAGAASEGKGKGKGKQAAPLALPDAADGRKLFLGGLAHTVTEAEVTAHFSQYGAVEEAVVKRDHEGNARGFGFVTFVEPGGMAMALADYDKHSIGGKWVETRPAGGYKGHSKGAGRPSPY
mmetsp:Transcript_39202/g.121537  ORF Transcript_39202/g.121537 Transcript_39202/m.121537 type:complete len:424 (+) Transcript_39202:52-1323(+)